MTERPTPTSVRDALAPVRDALLAEARADAEAARERARQSVAGVIAAAEAEAGQIRSLAREDALEQARGLQATAESHARRRAREVELAAERTAYDALLTGARRAAGRLLDEPGAAESVSALALRAAGPGAELVRTEDGFEAPGTGSRMVFSVTSLADAAVVARLRQRAT